MRPPVRGHAGLAAAAALMAVVAAGGCSGSEAPPRPSGPLEKVTLLTGFDVRGHEAYIQVAQAMGFFTDAGLDVTIQQGKGTVPNIQVLAAGKADFAVLDIAGAAIAYAGAPGVGRPMTDFTITSAIHQRSLSAIASLEGYGISVPRDLEGKRIAYSPGGVNFLLFPAYANLSGIDRSRITMVQTTPQQLMTLLATHKVDATVQVIVGKPAIEAATRRRALMLPYNEVWTDMFGNGLGTSRKTAAEKPDLVRRVNDALLKGLEYAVAHPQEAGDIFHKAYPAYPADAARQETELLAPYVRSEAGKPLGWIDENRLAKSIALLESQGLIHASFMPSELVSFDLTPQPQATK